jgi:hypothetical protein
LLNTLSEITHLTPDLLWIVIANTEVPGIVLEAELENEDGTTIYEIEIVKADGVEMEIEINAESGEVLTVEEDDGKKKGKKKRKS